MDYKDFQQNPGKYRLFKTARLNRNIPMSELKAGDFVSIEWYDDKPNALFIGSPVYPVYEVSGLKHWLFGNCLDNFCL